MPTIIVQTNAPGDKTATVTLAESVPPKRLHNDHYNAQLIERLGWALSDAEALESQPTEAHPQ